MAHVAPSRVWSTERRTGEGRKGAHFLDGFFVPGKNFAFRRIVTRTFRRSAPCTAPQNEAAAKSTKLVKSKSSAVVAVGGDSAKIYQKFKNSTRG